VTAYSHKKFSARKTNEDEFLPIPITPLADFSVDGNMSKTVQSFYVPSSPQSPLNLSLRQKEAELCDEITNEPPTTMENCGLSITLRAHPERRKAPQVRRTSNRKKTPVKICRPNELENIAQQILPKFDSGQPVVNTSIATPHGAVDVASHLHQAQNSQPSRKGAKGRGGRAVVCTQPQQSPSIISARTLMPPPQLPLPQSTIQTCQPVTRPMPNFNFLTLPDPLEVAKKQLMKVSTPMGIASANPNKSISVDPGKIGLSNTSNISVTTIIQPYGITSKNNAGPFSSSSSTGASPIRLVPSMDVTPPRDTHFRIGQNSNGTPIHIGPHTTVTPINLGPNIYASTNNTLSQNNKANSIGPNIIRSNTHTAPKHSSLGPKSNTFFISRDSNRIPVILRQNKNVAPVRMDANNSAEEQNANINMVSSSQSSISNGKDNNFSILAGSKSSVQNNKSGSTDLKSDGQLTGITDVPESIGLNHDAVTNSSKGSICNSMKSTPVPIAKSKKLPILIANFLNEIMRGQFLTTQSLMTQSSETNMRRSSGRQRSDLIKKFAAKVKRYPATGNQPRQGRIGTGKTRQDGKIKFYKNLQKNLQLMLVNPSSPPEVAHTPEKTTIADQEPSSPNRIYDNV